MGHFLTRAQAAHAVGVQGHDVLAMQGLLRLGSRFAIQECYPAFMFHGHLEEFRDVVSRFDGTDPWLVLGWMNEVRPELGGRSPAQWINEGRDSDRILSMAKRAQA